MYYIYLDNLSWDSEGHLNPHQERLLYMPGVDDLLVLNPKLTMEVNKAGSLEFKMPYNHIMLEDLHELRSNVIVRRDRRTIWKGRVTKIDRDFYKNASVYCEGALAFLNDTLVPPYEYKETTTTVQLLFEYFIGQHASEASEGRKIQLATPSCDVTKVSWEVEHYPELVITDGSSTGDETHVIDPNDTQIKVENKSYPQTLEELTSVLVDEYGGYLYLTYGANDTYYLGYYQKYGGTEQRRSRQKIMFGINLLDFSESQSAEDLFTRIRPIGASDLATDPAVIENKTAMQDYGKITRTETWSDIEDAKELLRKGRKRLLEGSRISQTIAIKAVDLQLLRPDEEDEIELGDKVGVFSAPHGINQEYICSQIIIDLQDPSNTEYVFGDVYTSLTGTRVSGNTSSVVLDNQAETPEF